MSTSPTPHLINKKRVCTQGLQFSLHLFFPLLPATWILQIGCMYKVRLIFPFHTGFSHMKCTHFFHCVIFWILLQKDWLFRVIKRRFHKDNSLDVDFQLELWKDIVIPYLRQNSKISRPAMAPEKTKKKTLHRTTWNLVWSFKAYFADLDCAVYIKCKALLLKDFHNGIINIKVDYILNTSL